MKILKEKSRSYKGTNYYKFKINIPEVNLRQANLKDGDELDIEIRDEMIILKKRNQ